MRGPYCIAESCIKCRQWVATPCRLHLDFNSLLTICTYSLFGVETGNHQLLFYPATEHGLDSTAIQKSRVKEISLLYPLHLQLKYIKICTIHCFSKDWVV